MRRVHINDEVWLYRVGQRSVEIRGPSGQKFAPTCGEIKGIWPEDFDRGKYKCTSDGMIFPSEVKEYIEGKLAE